MFVLILRPVSSHSLSSDKNRIMRANAHSTDYDYECTMEEKKRVSPALIVLNWIACKKQIKIELKLIEVDARLS